MQREVGVGRNEAKIASPRAAHCSGRTTLDVGAEVLGFKVWYIYEVQRGIFNGPPLGVETTAGPMA